MYSASTEQGMKYCVTRVILYSLDDSDDDDIVETPAKRSRFTSQITTKTSTNTTGRYTNIKVLKKFYKIMWKFLWKHYDSSLKVWLTFIVDSWLPFGKVAELFVRGKQTIGENSFVKSIASTASPKRLFPKITSLTSATSQVRNTILNFNVEEGQTIFDS